MTYQPDPLHNQPLPVVIAGQEFRVRELPWLRVKDYLGQFAIWSQRAAKPIQGLDDLSPQAILIDASDLAVAIIADCVNRQPAEIEALPPSALFELAELVLVAHERALKAFFHLRDRVSGLVTQTGNGSSPTPSPSPVSSMEDSH